MEINPLIRTTKRLDLIPDEPMIVLGEQEYLYDTNGKKYLDFCGGIWNVPFGYSDAHINERIIQQIKRLPFCSLISNVGEIQYNYAERLCKLLDMPSILYTCSGSETIEAAIKISRQYQAISNKNRRGISVFNLSYHGTSYGAMSISGVDKELVQNFMPLVPEIYWIEVPKHIYDTESWNYLIDMHFDRFHDKMAGIIIEPIMASGGIISIPRSTLKKIEELCRKYDILFVLDEVTTGFGRAGSLFLYQEYGLHPDLLCLSKGITNGYLPLGVLAFSKKVVDMLIGTGNVVEHFSSQGGNLLSIAAAEAVLDLLKDYKKYNVTYKGDLFQRVIKDSLKEKQNFDVRGKGLMIAISFPKTMKEYVLYDLLRRLRKKGILAYYFYNPGYNIGLSFFPQFTLSGHELEKIAKIITSQINKVVELDKA